MIVRLYHLPFPGAEPRSVADIMHKAGVNDLSASEVLDIVHRVRAADEP